ncbi:UDP-glucuronosyl/UDP-glucosyltransferase [Parasponia andersonii]|uniref:UDP-glucuronosyl/UDP-glucosyltransferase n=1 Tax=Parasponia andersonii TaxID=3476 RepID=A0A2P5AQD9_PARAD|nr:UDP-glucuronosyl/UDP-glucosyltransferase [Parasponia andersonii]
MGEPLPLWPWIKVNVDAAIRDFFVVKVGVTWNHRGEMVTCFALKLDYTNYRVAEAEAQAILSTINLAISNRREALMIESDCKEILELRVRVLSLLVSFLYSYYQKKKYGGDVHIAKRYSNPRDVLPKEFLDRIAERGKVVGWAPQGRWPLHTEQHLNAFKMVKEFGLGVEIKFDHKSGFYCENDWTVVSAQEIEGGIRRLIMK